MFNTVPTVLAPSASTISPKVMLWTGRVLSGLSTLLFLSSGINVFTKSPMVMEGMTHLGYPVSATPIIGVPALVSAIIYALPRTAVLGAILLTGYLGGAVASHLRVGDLPIGAVIFGILLWGGLYLRDKRVRELLPLRNRVQ